MRSRYPSVATVITAMIAQACGLVSSNHDVADDTSQAAGTAGQAMAGTSSSGGGNSGLGGTLIVIVPSDGGTSTSAPLPPECAENVPPFADQVIEEVGQQRIFYSWTTDEQVAELREGTELFSRSERPGLGRGLLFTDLELLAKAPSDTAMTQLADVLGNKTFAKARFAWPNPWATLLGLPGETYGTQLLRIELKPEAWIARFEMGQLSVVDAQNQPVPLETALASPERIGAIFHRSRGELSCGEGSFHRASVGLREFALGNIDMVQRWSLATPDITQRLESDVAELKLFEQQLECLGVTSGWSNDVTCAWAESRSPSARSNYDFSLGLPSELYRPSQENIEALIAALEASMPTGEPLSVPPE